MSHVTVNNHHNNNNNNNFNNFNISSIKDNISSAKNTSKRKVRDYNELIICSICKGYIIDATTINSCLHTCKYFKHSFKYLF